MPAAAQTTLTANFTRGAIAEYSNNPNGTDNGVLFSTLNIASMSISQLSGNGSWGGTQGNDTAVTATIFYTNGTTTTFPAAINWVRNAGGGQFDWVGLTLGAGVIVADGYNLTPGQQKTYVLEFPQSALNLSSLLPDGLDGSANTGAALNSLNQYFPTAVASPPVITGPSGGAGATASALSVNENQTAVTSLTASKLVTWAITGGTDAAKFSIAANGVVTFNGAPDFEIPTDSDTNNTYVLTVTATDSNGGASTQTITVTVLNVDDTAPAVATGQAFSYNENQSASTIVATVAATDAVGVTGFRFTATGTQTSADGYYLIDSAGVVRITAAGTAASVASNDFEIAPNSFVYGVQASDAAINWSQSIDVTLNVADLDDTAPVVAPGQSFSYAENQAANATVGTVSATDAIGVTGFRFGATGTQTSGDGYYTIDNAGTVKITSAGVAAGVAQNDFETAPNSFNYDVEARDAAGNWSLASSVTVNVTDVSEAPVVGPTPPVITGPGGPPGALTSSLSVNENQTAVTTLTANETVSWALSGGSDASKFAIDANGVITFVAAPDFEIPTDSDTNNSYILTVEATDIDGTKSTQTITITVLDLDDTAPLIAAGQSFAYTENQVATSVVGTVAASDALGVTGFRFSATGTQSSADGYYTIDSSGSVRITAAGVAEGVAQNDFETMPNSFIYSFQARDTAGNWSAPADVDFNVTDLNDSAPVISGPGGSNGITSSISVPEGSTIVTTLTANVPISSWMIVGGNDQGRFSVSPSGEITFVTVPDFEAPTDSDTNNVYVLTVQATDANGNSSQQTVTVNVTDLADTPPVINGPGGSSGPTSLVSVPEGTTSVTTLTSNVPVSWMITGGNDQGRFTVSPSGEITFVTAPDFEAPTDSDTNNAYLLTVTATDANGNVSQQTVTVTVTDIADTPPVISGPGGSIGTTSAVTVNEGSTTVTTLTSNVPVSWTITGGNDQGQFTISPSGEIIFVASPDFEAPVDSDGNNSYFLTVTATDANGQTSTQTITVTVADLADTPPVISGPNGSNGSASSVSVPEGSMTVANLTSNVPISSWTIVGGNDQGRFTVSSSGQVSFVTAPDFEAPNDSDTNNVYVLTVQATDANGNSSQQTITVNVTDLADTPPVVTGPNGSAGGSSSITVPEGSTVVTTLTSNVPIANWAIVGGNDQGRFTVSPSGQISFISPPDFEAPVDSDGNNSYVLTVEATDANGNKAVQTVTVNVSNVADTPPAITGPSGGPGAPTSAITMPEGTTTVTTVVSSVPVTWDISGGNDRGQFEISPAGVVSFVAAPNFERPADSDVNNTYVLTIRATDADGNVSVQTITVTVVNVEELKLKLGVIDASLRADLRNTAYSSLSTMLAFTEGMLGAEQGLCADGTKRPVSGSLNGTENHQNASLNFRRDLSACESRTRVSVDGGVGLTRVDKNWTTRGIAALRVEQKVGQNIVLGAAIVGSTASDDFASFKDGRISDTSVQLNFYGRARLTDQLRFSAFAGLGRSWYSFHLEEDDLSLRGKMEGKRYMYGAALSGDVKVGSLTITTDAILSRAIEKLGSANLDASYLDESESDIGLLLGRVDITRLSVPVHIPIVFGEERDGLKQSRLELSPGLLCQDTSADKSSIKCGYQFGLRFRAYPAPYSAVQAEARREVVDGYATNLFSLGVERRFGSKRQLAFGMGLERLGRVDQAVNRAIVRLTVGR